MECKARIIPDRKIELETDRRVDFRHQMCIRDRNLYGIALHRHDPMRLWSIHPAYLDPAGLTACWRDGLLARKVLLNQTTGYRNHPQLARLRHCTNPSAAIDTYLHGICCLLYTSVFTFGIRDCGYSD